MLSPLSLHPTERVDIRILECWLDVLRTLRFCLVGNVAHAGAAVNVGDRGDRRFAAEHFLVLGRSRVLPQLALDAVDELALDAEILDLALLQHADVLTQMLDVGRNMGRENDGAVACDLGQQIEEVEAFLGVKAGGRLVDDEHLGVADQCLGNAGAAKHTARVVAQSLLFLAHKTDRLNRRGDAGLALGLVLDALHDADVVEKFDDVKLGHELGALRQIAQRGAELVLVEIERLAVEKDFAIGCVHDGGDDAHERRFARAVAADQAENAIANGDVDAIQRLFLAAGVDFGDIFNFNIHGGFSFMLLVAQAFVQFFAPQEQISDDQQNERKNEEKQAIDRPNRGQAIRIWHLVAEQIARYKRVEHSPSERDRQLLDVVGQRFEHDVRKKANPDGNVAIPQCHTHEQKQRCKKQ